MSAFIDWFHRLWGAAAGDPDAIVAGAEARLGLRLPPLLRDVYLHTSLRSSQMMHLARVGDLELRSGVLVFAREQQACYDWGLPVVGGEADVARVLVELRSGWEEEGCSLEQFLRFFALANRPYEPPSCEVDAEPDRLVAPWQQVRVEWRNIQHQLWTDGEAVFEEVSGMLGARDHDALVRAALSLGVDPDDLEADD